MNYIIIYAFYSLFQYSSADIDACANSNTLPCLALLNLESLPRNDACDPVHRRNCQMNDLIDDAIASCRLKMVDPKEFGTTLHGDKRLNPDARCYPEVRRYVNIYSTRLVSVSAGNPTCAPATHGKTFVCGTQGTRCVCDTGMPTAEDPQRFLQHRCRCQWFVDYCSVPNICADGGSCTSIGPKVRCNQGSINQCVANPQLCGDDETCVELQDTDMVWEIREEQEGHGFACIKSDILPQLENFPYCNFRRPPHNMAAEPSSVLDDCCYRHLQCRRLLLDEAGGYLFKDRPCYCNVEFRKCLIRAKENDIALMRISQGLLSIVDEIKICSMDDTGRCDPRQSGGPCQKGDLISPSIAHCRVNCRTGPLPPIEVRSCRIRQCVPKNNIEDGGRIVDVPYHRESSRCDAVDDLPVRCGFHHTRCVCDGKPNAQYFTDRCRCQYWPMN